MMIKTLTKVKTTLSSKVFLPGFDFMSSTICDVNVSFLIYSEVSALLTINYDASSTSSTKLGEYNLIVGFNRFTIPYRIKKDSGEIFWL